MHQFWKLGMPELWGGFLWRISDMIFFWRISDMISSLLKLIPTGVQVTNNLNWHFLLGNLSS